MIQTHQNLSDFICKNNIIPIQANQDQMIEIVLFFKEKFEFKTKRAKKNGQGFHNDL